MWLQEPRLEERSKREAEQAALPPVDPLDISGKSAESVVIEYRLTISRAKIVSAIVIVLGLPILLPLTAYSHGSSGNARTVRSSRAADGSGSRPSQFLKIRHSNGRFQEKQPIHRSV